MYNCIDKLFKKNSKWINIYQGVETVDDPFEKNTTVSYISSKAIRALISDMTSTQAAWKMPGIKISRAKSIVVEKKHQNLLETSQKIEIITDNHVVESYEGWREYGSMQIRERGDYLEVNIFSKHT